MESTQCNIITVTFLTFAIFYWLETCHESRPHLTRGNYTKMWRLGGRILGAAFQPVCHNPFRVTSEAKKSVHHHIIGWQEVTEGHIKQDREEGLSEKQYLGRDMNKWRCEWFKNNLKFLEFGNCGKYARIESRKYALKWIIASAYSPVRAWTRSFLIFQLNWLLQSPCQKLIFQTKGTKWLMRWGRNHERKCQEFMPDGTFLCDVHRSRGENT